MAQTAHGRGLQMGLRLIDCGHVLCPNGGVKWAVDAGVDAGRGDPSGHPTARTGGHLRGQDALSPGSWSQRNQIRERGSSHLTPKLSAPRGPSNDQTGSRHHPEVAERMFVPATWHWGSGGDRPSEGVALRPRARCEAPRGSRVTVAPAPRLVPLGRVPRRPLLSGSSDATGGPGTGKALRALTPTGAEPAANYCARLAGFSALCSQHSQPFLGTRGHS